MSVKTLLPKLIETLTEFWQAITIVSDSGEAARVTNGGLDVNIQDQTTPIVDLFLSQKLTVLTLNANTIRNGETIDIVHDALITVGQHIEIWENNLWSQGEIESIALNTPTGGIDRLTLDVPMPVIFTTSAIVNLTNVNMAIDGSGTSVNFTFEPKSTDEYDITRGIGNMTHTSQGTDDLFGNLIALTVGMLLIKINPQLPVDGYLFNVKSNGDLRNRMFDLAYSDKAGPSSFGTSFRRTFAGQDKNGVTIRVDAATNELIAVAIRDNLTGLSSFRITVQGHVVE